MGFWALEDGNETKDQSFLKLAQVTELMSVWSKVIAQPWHQAPFLQSQISICLFPNSTSNYLLHAYCEKHKRIKRHGAFLRGVHSLLEKMDKETDDSTPQSLLWWGSTRGGWGRQWPALGSAKTFLEKASHEELKLDHQQGSRGRCRQRGICKTRSQRARTVAEMGDGRVERGWGCHRKALQAI